MSNSILLIYRTPRRIWPIAKASSHVFLFFFVFNSFPLYFVRLETVSEDRRDREVDVDE